MEELDKNSQIYVIDLETTSLEGSPVGHIVEIGIAVINKQSKTVNPVYDAVIHVPGIRQIDAETVNRDGSRGCWVFNNTSLTIEDVENGRPLEKVMDEVRTLISGKHVTAYNTPFDFDKFLYRDPWNIQEYTFPARDIADVTREAICDMLDRDKISNTPLKEKLIDHRRKYPDWIFRSEDAYKVFCADDPANLGMKQQHRAMDDAVREGWIMVRVASYLASRIFAKHFIKLFQEIGLIAEEKVE